MGVEASHKQSMPRHPIRVVTARTGLAPDLLRAWERRYGAVVPLRTDTGRRLYSDNDIEKLRLLKVAVDGGRRISDVSDFTIEQLREIVSEDHGAASAPQPIDQSLLEKALDAIAALDRARLERVLSEAAIQMSAPDVRMRLLVPLLNEVGDRWKHGTLRVVHEHLASAVVRSFVATHRVRRMPNGHMAPRVVVTTPAGQLHELGAVMVAAVAEELGWDVIYLGPDLPAHEIVAAVRQTQAKAVALSISYVGDRDALSVELNRLQDGLDNGAALLVGGRAANLCAQDLHRSGVTVVDGLGDLRMQLEQIA